MAAIIGKNLTLFLEGPAADAALGELLCIDGLSAEVVASGDPPQRTDWLSLTANLLQVASAPLVARELLAWFRSRREKPGGAHFACVIECPDGSRLNLHTILMAAAPKGGGAPLQFEIEEGRMFRAAEVQGKRLMELTVEESGCRPDLGERISIQPTGTFHVVHLIGKGAC